MGGVCITHGSRRNMCRTVVRNPERTHLGDLGADEKIISKWTVEKYV
jgi:hypothetical protein